MVKTSGNINGESIVMIHGWGMNSGAWEAIRPALESVYLVTWIDLPGYGLNGNLFARSMQDIVDLLVPVIPDGSHILGWSLGGLVSQAIAERLTSKASNMLKSLTLVASLPRFSQADDWQHAISQDVLNNFSSNLRNHLENTLKRFVALQFMGIKGTREIQKRLISDIVRSSISNSTDKTAKKGGGGSLAHDDPHYQALCLGLDILKHADYRMASHSIPQHWVLADRDRLILPAVMDDLRCLRPDDQITLIEQAGHAPFMTHPEAFLACINPFIQNHSSCFSR